MKIQELRIGNLIYLIDRSNEVHLTVEIPFVVAEITQKSVKAYPFKEHLYQVLKYEEFSIRDIQPIPLTEEWLLRFKLKNNYIFYCRITDNGYEVYYRREFTTKIHYVHQLQNLYFALTNQELS